MSLIADAELEEPEYHTVRFEGLINIFENNVKSIVKLRDLFKQQLNKLETGKTMDVREWKIVDFDGYLKAR